MVSLRRRRLPHALAPGGDRRGGRPERRLLAESDLDALLERLALLGPDQDRECEEGDGEAPAHHVVLRRRTRRTWPTAIASAGRLTRRGRPGARRGATFRLLAAGARANLSMPHRRGRAKASSRDRGGPHPPMANGVTPRLTFGTEARAARVDLGLPPRTRKRSLTTAADPPPAVRCS